MGRIKPYRAIQPIVHHMAGDGKTRCERPKDLKGKPQECSPEQARKCHGQGKEHPCVKATDKI